MIPDQVTIQDQANYYFDCKRLKARITTGITEEQQEQEGLEQIDADLCSGLVGYWLYLSRIGQAEKFSSRLEYLAAWDDKLFKATTLKTDKEIEQLLYNLLLFAYPERLVATSRQHDIATSFALGADQEDPKIGKSEFSLTFIFNRESLSEVLEQLVQPNKMFRISNGFHIIGVMLIDGQYQVYDPNSKSGVLTTNSFSEIAEHIFKGLKDLQGKQEFLALNISSYDLQGCSPGTYFEPVAYCQEKLADPNYLQQMKQHKFLLYLAAKYNEYGIIDLMYANGYEYIPWKGNRMDEVHECIEYYDIHKLQFLLKKGLPATSSSLDYAVDKQMLEAIVLLLCAGAEIKKSTKDAIKHKYGVQGAKIIYEHALDMIRHILNLEKIDIENVTRLGFYEQQLIRAVANLTDGLQLPKLDWDNVQDSAIRIAEQIHKNGKIELSDIPTAQLIVENLRVAAFESGIDISNECDKALDTIQQYIDKNKISTKISKPNSLFFSSQMRGSLDESKIEPVLEECRAKLRA